MAQETLLGDGPARSFSLLGVQPHQAEAPQLCTSLKDAFFGPGRVQENEHSQRRGSGVFALAILVLAFLQDYL